MKTILWCHICMDKPLPGLKQWRDFDFFVKFTWNEVRQTILSIHSHTDCILYMLLVEKMFSQIEHQIAMPHITWRKNHWLRMSTGKCFRIVVNTQCRHFQDVIHTVFTTLNQYVFLKVCSSVSVCKSVSKYNIISVALWSVLIVHTL